MIVFRQADHRFPFLWSTESQTAARWHANGEGPAHYFADTPAGAWAEFIRHEEIRDPEDLATVRRALWAVEIGDDALERVSLPAPVMTGGPESYRRCQDHARRLRARGTRRLVAPSAALLPGAAAGREVVGGHEQPASGRDGRTIVLFGPPDGLVGWQAVDRGPPPADVLERVRHYDSPLASARTR
jgi:RES domain